MTASSHSPTPRREFLGQMAASAMVLAGAACATPMSAAQTAAAPVPSQPGGAPTKWDDSWTGRLTSKHKAVFDSPEVAENTTLGVSQAIRYINGVRDALAAEAQTVVVIRHKAIPFAFNDAMWEKYKIGEESKVKIGDAWATKNPLLNGRGNAAGDRPQGNLVWLASHGHILLGCDLATQGFAAGYAEKAKATTKEVYEELKANLVPGMILQPNGVYAVLRAQEAGCVYMRST
jgi:hypothetical protein